MDEIVELPPTPPASPASPSVESNRSSGDISYQDPLPSPPPPPPHPILHEIFQEMLHFPINVPSPSTTSSDDFLSEPVPASQPNRWLDLRARAAPWMQLLIYTLALLAILLGALAIIITSHKHRTNHHCGIKLTVAQDGKSQYQTIFEAVQASPSYSSSRVCVVIGKGEYYENIDIPEEKTNLVFIGDGVEDTVIVSDRSTIADSTNRSIATLWVRGKHFSAQDLTIKNTALEGLALNIHADQSVFFDCKFEGASTTVHIRGYKQFFSNCTFYGRNNTIVADSYTFFQDCDFYAVKLYPEEKLVFVGQTHDSVPQTTRLTFYLCGFNTIGRAIKSPASAFIGSALDHDYARFAVIRSFLDERIAGYLLDGSSVTSASVAIYGNTGSGSAMKVSPPYVQKLVDLSTASASEYSLRTLLDGESWIPKEFAYELDFI